MNDDVCAQIGWNWNDNIIQSTLIGYQIGQQIVW